MRHEKRGPLEHRSRNSRRRAWGPSATMLSAARCTRSGSPRSSGSRLGVTFTVCFVTGFLSHLIQHPPSFFTWPARPAWLLPRLAGHARHHRDRLDPAAAGEALDGVPAVLDLASPPHGAHASNGSRCCRWSADRSSCCSRASLPSPGGSRGVLVPAGPLRGRLDHDRGAHRARRGEGRGRSPRPGHRDRTRPARCRRHRQAWGGLSRGDSWVRCAGGAAGLVVATVGQTVPSVRRDLGARARDPGTGRKACPINTHGGPGGSSTAATIPVPADRRRVGDHALSLSLADLRGMPQRSGRSHRSRASTAGAPRDDGAAPDGDLLRWRGRPAASAHRRSLQRPGPRTRSSRAQSRPRGGSRHDAGP